GVGGTGATADPAHDRAPCAAASSAAPGLAAAMRSTSRSAETAALLRVLRHPGSLITVGPFEQLVDGEDRLVHSGVQIAELGDALGHGRYRAVVRLDVADLVP